MRKIVLSSVAAIALLTTQSEVANSTGEIKNTQIDKMLPLEIAKKFNSSHEATKNENENVEDKDTDKYEDYGTYEITAYTNHEHSTGKTSKDKQYGITASGTYTKEGRTIASDWDVLPKGTKVFIEGIGERIVEDKGGLIKGKKIDVYFESEEEAIKFGRRKLRVYKSEVDKE